MPFLPTGIYETRLLLFLHAKKKAGMQTRKNVVGRFHRKSCAQSLPRINSSKWSRFVLRLLMCFPSEHKDQETVSGCHRAAEVPRSNFMSFCLLPPSLSPQATPPGPFSLLFHRRPCVCTYEMAPFLPSSPFLLLLLKYASLDDINLVSPPFLHSVHMQGRPGKPRPPPDFGLLPLVCTVEEPLFSPPPPPQHNNKGDNKRLPLGMAATLKEEEGGPSSSFLDASFFSSP